MVAQLALDLVGIEEPGEARLNQETLPGLLPGELLVDLFAGGGGASLGIQWALGRGPDVAVNHCPQAIRMHERNHPETRHYCCDVFEVDPIQATHGRPVGLLWMSPDCTHHSRAKGAKPLSNKRRALPEVGLVWARAVRPRILILENVPEFLSWGPLDSSGRPLMELAGTTFRYFVDRLELIGYQVEWRVLRACDYGSPTKRQRLFLVARCDGQPIQWPLPRYHPNEFRIAGEFIDWSRPVPSIFERERPLCEASCRRLATGVVRFVLKGDPFWAPISSTPGRHPDRVAAFLAKHNGKTVGQALHDPIHTITTQDTKRLITCRVTKNHTDPGCARVAGFLVKYYGSGGQHQSLDEPLHTIVTRARFGLVTVTVDGRDWALSDIGMRMLTPAEYASCQGFPETYQWYGSIADQIARVGNSVPPHCAMALVRAQLTSVDAGLEGTG